MAKKLLSTQINDEKQSQSIIDFLCADSGSHDYTINRREAADLGLNIEKPSNKLYKVLRKIHLSYAGELQLLEPYSPEVVLGSAQSGNPVSYTISRALVEGTVGGSYGFVSAGTLIRVPVQVNNIEQLAVQDNRTFDGWRKLI